VRLISLNEGDAVVDVTLIAGEKESEGGEGEELEAEGIDEEEAGAGDSGEEPEA